MTGRANRMIIPYELEGRHVVVLGASHGVGWELAKVLQKKGASLSLASRSMTIKEEEWSLSRGQNSRSFLYNVDVSNEESIHLFKEEAIKRFGHVDVLVNCAGVGYFSPAEDIELKKFEEMISVNLTGTFLSCQTFGREMLKQGSGKIFNIVSIAGKVGMPGCIGYSASKFGVSGITQVLQAEWRNKGIQVTAVYPGAINSTFWENQDWVPDQNKMIPTDVFTQSIISLIEMPQGSFTDEITIMPPSGIL